MRYTSFIPALFLISLVFAFSCTSKPEFTVEGVVKNGEGKILYLENVGTNFVKLVDSVCIDKNQTFRLKGENKTGAPDFYRIRLKNQFINLAVDSTETIRIQSDTLNFARNYTVENSPENEKIKEVTLLQVQTNLAYSAIQKSYEAREISLEEAISRMEEVLGNYKNKAKEYILADMYSASAYFALFQQINDQLIFEPYDKGDSKIYGAVANAWNMKYSDASRTQHLVAIFKGVLSDMRKQNIELNPQETTTLEALDFTLRAVNDWEYTLSEAAKGKVLLLDFTAYIMDESPSHTLLLSSVYEKYHERGFEIFQVSLDADQHFWKNAAVNLPWICVFDPQSIYSGNARMFNVQSIPCGFLFDRNGEIVSRIEDFTDLEKEVLPLLK